MNFFPPQRPICLWFFAVFHVILNSSEYAIQGVHIMERIRQLTRYQKTLLLLLFLMIPVFAFFYATTIAQVGFDYQETLFLPTTENGTTVYAATFHGQPSSFTVSADKTVLFQCGDKTYGPYTAREDASAVPQNQEMAELLTGVEFRRGDEILFRGGVLKSDDFYWLYTEDGLFSFSRIVYATTNSSEQISMDADGNLIDLLEPSIPTLLELMDHPTLTHRGNWLSWFGGAFLCIVTALSMLFADELFRWDLSFRIRDAYEAEPSDWEIAGRYVGWTAAVIIAVVLFVLGLQ